MDPLPAGPSRARTIISQRAQLKGKFTRVRTALQREVEREARGEDVSRATLAELWSEADGLRRQINGLVDDLHNVYGLSLELESTQKAVDTLHTWCLKFDLDCEVLYTARAILERLHARALTVSRVDERSHDSVSTWIKSINNAKPDVDVSACVGGFESRSDFAHSALSTSCDSSVASENLSVCERARRLEGTDTMYTSNTTRFKTSPSHETSFLSDHFVVGSDQSRIAGPISQGTVPTSINGVSSSHGGVGNVHLPVSGVQSNSLLGQSVSGSHVHLNSQHTPHAVSQHIGYTGSAATHTCTANSLFQPMHHSTAVATHSPSNQAFLPYVHAPPDATFRLACSGTQTFSTHASGMVASSDATLRSMSASQPLYVSHSSPGMLQTHASPHLSLTAGRSIAHAPSAFTHSTAAPTNVYPVHVSSPNAVGQISNSSVANLGPMHASIGAGTCLASAPTDLHVGSEHPAAGQDANCRQPSLTTCTNTTQFPSHDPVQSLAPTPVPVEPVSLAIDHSVNFSAVIAEAVQSAAVCATQAAVQATYAHTHSGADTVGHDVHVPNPSVSPRTTTSNQMQLPKLTLPSFSGDVLEWPEFWGLFSATVHSNDTLQDVMKFSYLKSCMKGTAAKAISGIPVTDVNYASAVDTLISKFGKPDVLIANLFAKLQHLPTSSSKFSDVKRTHETLETYLRQLTALGRDLESEGLLVQQILAKFPVDVTAQLEDRRQEDTPWTVTSVRDALRRYVRVHENVHQVASVQQPSRVNLVSSPGPSRRIVADATHRYSAESLVATSSATSSSKYRGSAKSAVSQSPRPCIFCGNEHLNSECTKFASPTDRRDRLREQERCFICLRKGHFSKTCSKRPHRSCKHCGKDSHHYLLCSSNAKGSQSSAADAKSTPGKTTLSGVATTHSLAAVDDVVFLQTAVVTFDTSDGPLEAHILFDTGSYNSYITSSLAHRLKLRPVRTDSLSICTFGVKESYDTTSVVVEFNIPCSDPSLRVQAHSVPHITNPVNRAPLPSRDWPSLEQHRDKLAHPPSRQSSKFTVDILIGSDYFWEIIADRHSTLPSGLQLLNSSLGLVIGGRPAGGRTAPSNTGPSTVTTALFVSTQINCTLPISSNVSSTDPVPASHPDGSDLWSLERIGITDPSDMCDNV